MTPPPPTPPPPLPLFLKAARANGGESARAALGERTLAARGAVDRTDGRLQDGQGGGRVLVFVFAFVVGLGRPKQAQVAHEQDRGEGEGETTVLPKNGRGR